MKWMMIFVALLLAGCADPVAYEISGAFTQDRTNDDLATFDAKVQSLNGEAVLMESFPEQYRVTFSTQGDCDAFHNWVHLQSFIDQTHDNHCKIV